MSQNKQGRHSDIEWGARKEEEEEEENRFDLIFSSKQIEHCFFKSFSIQKEEGEEEGGRGGEEEDELK